MRDSRNYDGHGNSGDDGYGNNGADNDIGDASENDCGVVYHDSDDDSHDSDVSDDDDDGSDEVDDSDAIHYYLDNYGDSSDDGQSLAFLKGGGGKLLPLMLPNLQEKVQWRK